MLTKTHAVNSTYRQEFYHVTLKNSRDGSPVRCRVNGQCKTWKTRPNEFMLPVKYGLKECFYITERNASDWYDPTDAAIGTTVVPVITNLVCKNTLVF